MTTYWGFRDSIKIYISSLLVIFGHTLGAYGPNTFNMCAAPPWKADRWAWYGDPNIIEMHHTFHTIENHVRCTILLEVEGAIL